MYCRYLFGSDELKPLKWSRLNHSASISYPIDCSSDQHERVQQCYHNRTHVYLLFTPFRASDAGIYGCQLCEKTINDCLPQELTEIVSVFRQPPPVRSCHLRVKTQRNAKYATQIRNLAGKWLDIECCSRIMTTIVDVNVTVTWYYSISNNATLVPVRERPDFDQRDTTPFQRRLLAWRRTNDVWNQLYVPGENPSLYEGKYVCLAHSQSYSETKVIRMARVKL